MGPIFPSLPDENFRVHPLVLLFARLEGECCMDFRVARVFGIAVGSPFHLPHDDVSVVGLEDDSDIEVKTGSLAGTEHGGPVRGRAHDVPVKILVALSTPKRPTLDRDQNPGPPRSFRHDHGLGDIKFESVDEFERGGVDVLVGRHGFVVANGENRMNLLRVGVLDSKISSNNKDRNVLGR
eukprot:CAMPEP_0194180550 /NCGR_PEP_ID=MMETSP0154-20130528/16982_1 /TAXON_ID=1049557 /ORGANISM="Thalassiothrix antarctica, Strain L6-D1" /LENGTH=180 /DNA_ID=CAMNT_0038896267 /DNA_START=77 /DNA_END=615 /DNA_ORIENTATION=-